MGVTRFSGSVGYRGVVKIQKNETRTGGDNPTMVSVLATSGSFQMGHNPLIATGVWGAGYMNAVEQTIYANDVARLEGSVGLEYTAGDVFEAIKAMCFDFRGNKYGTYLHVLPDGVYGFKGFGWASSLSFSASQGSIVTGDFNWTSYLDGVRNTITVDDEASDSSAEDEINTPYGASGNSGGSAKPTSPGPFMYNGVYPYWGTDIYDENNVLVPDVMSWSANYDSSIEILKCCGMKNGTYTDEEEDSLSPLAPDYLGLGPMSASCNMEVFRLKGDFSDNSLHKRTAFKFDMKTPASNAGTDYTYIISLPRVVCNNKSSQVQQGSGWITASYSFNALGDFMGPPLDLQKKTNG